MNISKSSYQLNNLNKINVLLGKNGSGKSTILKALQGDIPPQGENEIPIFAEYITPERGGFLKYEAGVDSNISSNPGWLENTRKVNQFNNFKEQTVTRYKDLELRVLREIAGPPRITDERYSFQTYIDNINTLLENIEMRAVDKIFKLYKKNTTNEIDSKNISSGESELIALAIETIFFQRNPIGQESKILLLDEPDVHLHPDLQVRFMKFIHKLVTTYNFEFTVIIATHSTAILGALEDSSDVNVAFMKAGQTIIDFKPISDTYKKFLPVFGAHPLSNVFNEAPVLLVEGEDDERIWQQVVRSSLGKIKVFPCVCGDKAAIGNYESEIKEVIESVYNDAKAYSLKDRDDSPEADLTDDPPIIKHRLRCYGAENLLLSDEVLNFLNTSWEELKGRIEKWVSDENNVSHVKYVEMKTFVDDGLKRKDVKIKELRNLLIYLIGTNKSWEIAVGQTIANLHWSDTTDFNSANSIFNYLGEKLTKGLIPKRS